MRDNQPVTQREFEFPDNATLMSTTDTQSHITYANDAFVAVSGYSRDELTGQPHNMVRHPDMPAEAFADMWATLKGGEPWTALVKNRRKNGDHYWVRANATPVMRGGRAVGYMSVRTKASREEIAAAQALHKDFRDGKAGARRFHKGLIVAAGPLGLGSWLQTMSVRWRIRWALLALWSTPLAAAAGLGVGGAPLAILGSAASAAALPGGSRPRSSARWRR
jgi:aerotaxis receptor